MNELIRIIKNDIWFLYHQIKQATNINNDKDILNNINLAFENYSSAKIETIISKLKENNIDYFIIIQPLITHYRLKLKYNN